MRFREKLEKYKNGTLEEELRKQVEADIERQEAISDYLVDQMEEDWTEAIGIKSDDGDEGVDSEAEKLTRMINRSIRKAFVKMGIIVTAISMAVVLFIAFGLSPLVSMFYYNPAETVVKATETSSELNRMSLDYMVYSNLTMPGYYRDNVSVESRGFGKYSIEIMQTLSYSNQFVNVGGTVDKGKLTLYNTNALKRPSDYVFAGCGLPVHGTISERVAAASKGLKENEAVYHWHYNSPQEAREELQKLDDDKYYRGYITFQKELNFTQMQKFLEELPDDSNGEWCGVKTGEEYRNMRLGYFTQSYGSADSWEIEGYPNLNLYEGLDMEQEGFWNQAKERMKDEDWCRKHMVSMLRYLEDQKKFQKLMSDGEFDYAEAAEYVENHEMEYYGMTIVGTKDALLQLDDLESVYGIYVEETQ